MNNTMKTIDDLTENIFWYGAGIVGAEDIAPEDKDKAIMNTLAHAKKEAKQALSTMLSEILPQGKQEQHACGFNDGKQQCDCYHQSIIDARQRATDRGFTL